MLGRSLGWRRQFSADNLTAGSFGHIDPGLGIVVILGGSPAAISNTKAVILACLDYAIAFLIAIGWLRNIDLGIHMLDMQGGSSDDGQETGRTNETNRIWFSHLNFLSVGVRLMSVFLILGSKKLEE
ncbi:hypothetical protein HNQ77_000976 [Silvibacterium bohemicum]|uniref:Uncharacterized protein n=1 Tax=Silvibacterium bohemicum TaxID=1577686 RepID=A0A841JNT9_9BACT|nr:hypothetical protein [Silvibacterium bohemicum]MBB6143032.1 hypothetical protein [Silvibacterium bohemicum]